MDIEKNCIIHVGHIHVKKLLNSSKLQENMLMKERQWMQSRLHSILEKNMAYE